MKKKLAFATIMGAFTTGIISFSIISINIGFKPNFMHIWLKSWSMGYVLVIPVILFIGPLVQKLVNRIFSEKQ